MADGGFLGGVDLQGEGLVAVGDGVFASSELGELAGGLELAAVVGAGAPGGAGVEVGGGGGQGDGGAVDADLAAGLGVLRAARGEADGKGDAEAWDLALAEVLRIVCEVQADGALVFKGDVFGIVFEEAAGGDQREGEQDKGNTEEGGHGRSFRNYRVSDRRLRLRGGESPQLEDASRQPVGSEGTSKV